jgi:hypothetical protein
MKGDATFDECQNYPIGRDDRRAALYQSGTISPASRLLNNNININIMAPILLTKKTGFGLALTEDTKARRSRRPLIPFILTTILVLGYYATTPILTACSHRHGKLSVEERAIKILSENPLIGT